MEKSQGKTKIYCLSLFLAKKSHLLEYFDDMKLLNKKSEFIYHCRHKINYYLKVYKETVLWFDTKY